MNNIRKFDYFILIFLMSIFIIFVVSGCVLLIWNVSQTHTLFNNWIACSSAEDVKQCYVLTVFDYYDGIRQYNSIIGGFVAFNGLVLGVLLVWIKNVFFIGFHQKDRSKNGRVSDLGRK